MLSGFPPNHILSELSSPISEFLTNQSIVIVQEKSQSELMLEGEARKAKKSTQQPRSKSISDLKPSNSKLPPRKRGRKSKQESHQENTIDNQQDLFELIYKQQIDDIGEAVTNDETEKKTVVTIRNAMKEMLEERYRENLATKRQEAMLSGNYKFEDLRVYRLEDSRQAMFKVSFKSFSDSSWISEHHQAFSKEELFQIIKAVINDPDGDGEELLKTYKMCYFSPRTFWSLVYHYKDVRKGLEQLFPKRDWSTLDSRKVTLTERAMKVSESGENIYYESDDEDHPREKKVKVDDEDFTLQEDQPVLEDDHIIIDETSNASLEQF